MILDTGSTGLRIASAALNASLQPGAGLPLVAGAQAPGKLTECEAYISSYVYGPVVKADVVIAGKKVGSTQLQVFGASGYMVPRSCSSSCSSLGGTETNTTESFGGNGLLGVSFDTADNYALYYDCPTPNAAACAVDVAYAGIPNTVTQFAGDNNGVTISLPAIAAGTTTKPVWGTLYFGVATQADNTPAATTLAVANDGSSGQNSGTFNALIGGAWSVAYIDSGTDVVYFNDAADTQLTDCPANGFVAGFYCPASAQSLSFGLGNAGSSPVVFGNLAYTVGNASLLYGVSAVATSAVGGPDSSTSTASNSSVAFGLSAFYGHTIYFLFNGMSAPGTGLGGSASTPVVGPVNGID